jgi:hypothetical protein
MIDKTDSRLTGEHATPAHIATLYRQALAMLWHNRPLRLQSSPATQARPALSEPEIDALKSVGANLNPWPPNDPRDPLTRTVADFMALIESSYSTAEVARFLRVDSSRVRQRIRERSLCGMEYEGGWRLPRFQFERRRVLPGLPEVLAALRPEISPLDVAQWFLSPHPDLELPGDESVTSPRDWLLRGLPPGAVVELAAELGQGIS